MFYITKEDPVFMQRWADFIELQASQKTKPWWFNLNSDQVEIRKQEMKLELEDSNKRLDKELGEDRLL